MLRRARLLSAGVRLRRELAADSVWSNVMRYTFIARRPEGDETGVRSVHALREGSRVRGRTRGIERSRAGVFRLADGFRIVDVFDEGRSYLGSVVADSATTPRDMLLHLGRTRRHSEIVDRLYLSPEAVVRWRDLLPIVVQNRGYGPLYGRKRRRDEAITTEGGVAMGDSVVVTAATRYELEELDDYTLIGRDAVGERYRHIFATGGEYVMTAVGYGPRAPAGSDLLVHLGLAHSKSSRP